MEHTISELKELYMCCSKFYDNNIGFPFINLGLLGEIQVKTYYDKPSKTLLIAWESSRPNRTHKSLKLRIDWIINLIAFPSKLIETETKDNPIVSNFMEGFKTHSGFSVAFISTINDFNNIIKKHLEEGPIEHILTYGWSQGGVLSLMTHLWLKTIFENTKYENVDMQTFTIGTPRFIHRGIFYNKKKWKKLIEKFDGVHMFANKNDLITKVPFKWMGYVHPIELVKLEGPFNFFKVIRPWVFHIKERYDPLVEAWFEERLKKIA